MKARILTAAAIWLAVISALHIQLNVTWSRLADNFRVMLGGERQELIVGFLPVT